MTKYDQEAGPDRFRLEEFLPYRLSLLANTVSDGIAAGYRDRYEISVTEWRILAVLGRYPGLNASEVCDRTAMDKVPVSRAVKTLLNKKLITRKTDGDDRRRRQLFITPDKGQQVLDEIIPQARAYESRLIETLTKEELNSFRSVMEKLQHQAKNYR